MQLLANAQFRRPCRRRRAFTLIELMVVAAVIATLLTLTVPAILSLKRESALSGGINLVRANLLSARAYSMKNQVVSGVRMQGDGHVVRVYAANMADIFNLDDYTNTSIYRYQMVAIEGIPPTRLEDPCRVTMYNYDHYDYNWRESTFRKIFNASPDWACGKGWWVYPAILFGASGRVILAEAQFLNSGSNIWHPKADDSGSAFHVATCDSAGDVSEQYRNQQYPHGSDAPINTPALCTDLKFIDYDLARGYLTPTVDTMTSEAWGNLYRLVESSDEVRVDVQTGMVIRRADSLQTEDN
jgi:prepilin-type N-terminal cleavage/methylation domain-containing protein